MQVIKAKDVIYGDESFKNESFVQNVNFEGLKLDIENDIDIYSSMQDKIKINVIVP